MNFEEDLSPQLIEPTADYPAITAEVGKFLVDNVTAADERPSHQAGTQPELTLLTVEQLEGLSPVKICADMNAERVDYSLPDDLDALKDKVESDDILTSRSAWQKYMQLSAVHIKKALDDNNISYASYLALSVRYQGKSNFGARSLVDRHIMSQIAKAYEDRDLPQAEWLIGQLTIPHNRDGQRKLFEVGILADIGVAVSSRKLLDAHRLCGKITTPKLLDQARKAIEDEALKLINWSYISMFNDPAKSGASWRNINHLKRLLRTPRAKERAESMQKSYTSRANALPPNGIVDSARSSHLRLI